MTRTENPMPSTSQAKNTLKEPKKLPQDYGKAYQCFLETAYDGYRPNPIILADL